MPSDPITTAASAAIIGAGSAVITGSAPDLAVVAALAGAICSAWARPGSAPAWSRAYVVGTLVHTLLSFGAGLSGAALLPAFYAELVRVPPWALTFPLSAGAHLIIPSLHEVRKALVERIRGRTTGDRS